MKLMKTKLLILIVTFLLGLSLAGCENESQIKGVKERGKLEEEPEISVEVNGNTEKMKLEKYITAVVAGEMHKNWPENAYGAQAILARSYALKHMEDEQTDIISGSFAEAQEYKPGAVSDEVKAAVEKTRGEVALYQDQYISSWFHSSAGGQTTTAKVGLGYKDDEPPYIKSVKSPDDLAPEDIQKWTAEFTNEELNEGLKKMGENIGQIQDMTIKNRDDTGRAKEFVFKGSKGDAEVVAAEYRNQLDTKKLKSTKIDSIQKTGNGFSITGSGFGHGVGMSQWGAYSMAKDNKTPEDIIRYYFGDIEIARVYD